MSKLFGWFNKNKNENKTPEPATNPPQEETSDSNEAIAVEKELPEPEQVEEAQPEVVEEANQPIDKVESEAEEVSTDEPKTPEELVVEAVEATPQQQVTPEVEPEVEQPPETQAVEESAATEKKSFFGRLKASLSRTKANLGSGIVSLFRGKAIDDDLYEELETQLLVADVGMDTTQKIIDRLVEGAKHSQLKNGDALYELLKQQLRTMLTAVQQPLPEVIANHDKAQGPFVILMVGVNGVGKTTTIGKLAKQYQQQGKKVMLAAGDTFRAAAVEQLQVWGERNNIPVIAQPTGSDSASVLYDALQSAKAKGSDILIADTAGRLQNKDNLMEELKKVVRVMKKLNPDAPHEVMLTVDAATGQNAISQAKLFKEAVGLTGITLTKLDGTAKGGVIFAIADKFGIPIRYIGVGEGIDDLRGFNGDEFIDALFSEGEKS
ncbi:signal recognition particle-docking protein FtsY [Alteromonas oceani]|uniref:Signal recognition particle receptor FtsY n=1 Tax=Alteromonas oceani TaxID=2071609 RepID=A0ABV7JTV1_9ALTE|nr:signal recognition particle-docking protein FtsY [Alteromonas oceani]